MKMLLRNGMAIKRPKQLKVQNTAAACLNIYITFLL